MLSNTIKQKKYLANKNRSKNLYGVFLVDS